jgi:predicted TPR repeat methyltransferase
MTQQMLDKAYDLDGAEATQSFYDAWAVSYDQELTDNGYATPQRCAEALAEFAENTDAPLLDFGCGTGFSGLALKACGFEHLEGCDFSTEMLKAAETKKIYENLVNTSIEDPIPFESAAYANIAAVGVLNPGHAPATTLDDLLALLPAGGLFVFSLNDHALEDRTYEARLNEHVDCGHACLLFREYGPHLPKIDLQSNVYVLKKL